MMWEKNQYSYNLKIFLYISFHLDKNCTIHDVEIGKHTHFKKFEKELYEIYTVCNGFFFDESSTSSF